MKKAWSEPLSWECPACHEEGEGPYKEGVCKECYPNLRPVEPLAPSKKPEKKKPRKKRRYKIRLE